MKKTSTLSSKSTSGKCRSCSRVDSDRRPQLTSLAKAVGKKETREYHGLHSNTVEVV